MFFWVLVGFFFIYFFKFFGGFCFCFSFFGSSFIVAYEVFVDFIKVMK